jgi:serine kinase of HPr protein (carbohydrate metabolism regulator)
MKIKIEDILQKMELQVLSGHEMLDKEITGGYAGDLLSDVLANSRKGNIWITSQIHQNIIAVASSKELSGIIIANHRIPEKETLEKSNEEKIPVMISNMFTYEITGKLYETGIR